MSGGVHLCGLAPGNKKITKPITREIVKVFQRYGQFLNVILRLCYPVIHKPCF